MWQQEVIGIYSEKMDNNAHSVIPHPKKNGFGEKKSRFSGI
jgi:hypothetical protein